MFSLITGVILIFLIFLAFNGLKISIINSDVNSKINDSSVNTHKDVLIFNELKILIKSRAEAESMSCIGDKVVSIRDFDNKVIDISKRISSNN